MFRDYETLADSLRETTQVTFSLTKDAIAKYRGPNIPGIMKALKNANQEQVLQWYATNQEGLAFSVDIGDKRILLYPDMLETSFKGINGWEVASEKGYLVMVDTRLTPELVAEGFVREFIHTINDLRKNLGYGVADQLILKVRADSEVQDMLEFSDMDLCTETSSHHIDFVHQSDDSFHTLKVNDHAVKVSFN
mgnify:CR=1 FL=1